MQLSPIGKQMPSLSWVMVIPMRFFFYYYEISESPGLGPSLLPFIKKGFGLGDNPFHFVLGLSTRYGRTEWVILDPQMLFAHPLSTSVTDHSLPGTAQSARKIMSANMGHEATVSQANLPRVA